MIYYGTVVTVVAFILWYSGVSKVSTSTSGVFTGILPISTLIGSFLILGGVIMAYHVIGILLVIIGIFISSYEKKIMQKD